MSIPQRGSILKLSPADLNRFRTLQNGEAVAGTVQSLKDIILSFPFGFIYQV
jgi:hypothetical protein